ncbi:hypothetical protein ACFX2I_028892 [Malus domestica]
MAAMYLSDLREMLQNIATQIQQHDSLPEKPNSEQTEKLKLSKTMLERLISVLESSECSMSPAGGSCARAKTPKGALTRPNDHFNYDQQFVCRPPCVIVFRHITAPMLADEEDKISVLALMDLMAPDCDISVLDGLKYVSRFGIPLKKYWKT